MHEGRVLGLQLRKLNQSQGNNRIIDEDQFSVPINAFWTTSTGCSGTEPIGEASTRHNLQLYFQLSTAILTPRAKHDTFPDSNLESATFTSSILARYYAPVLHRGGSYTNHNFIPYAFGGRLSKGSQGRQSKPRTAKPCPIIGSCVELRDNGLDANLSARLFKSQVPPTPVLLLMSLLNIDTFSLEDFFHETVPPYAILSHTWGRDNEELSFQDVARGRYNDPATRPAKVEGCCEQARRDGYLHVWIDTCCIDKANAVELQEAINSMFRWYKNAAICYAYLSDVSTGGGGIAGLNSGGSRASPHQAVDGDESAAGLAASCWWTRGWTLQELLAPHDMRFYDAAWQLLGTKGELWSQIYSITGIPPMILLGITELRGASVAQRMSWAATRVTKRTEDMAYCLLGVFGVTMPMIYGEGGDKAFRRLQEQIMKDVKDDSILAWGCQLRGTDASEEPAEILPGRLLAASPADFAKCGDILSSPQSVTAVTNSADLFAGRLRLCLPIVESDGGRLYGLLGCHGESSSDLALGIPLLAVGRADAAAEYARPHGSHTRLVPKPNASDEGSSARVVSIHVDSSPSQLPSNDQAPYWYWIQNPVQEIRLVEVEPASLWRKERALIESYSSREEEHTAGLIVLRFRHQSPSSSDVVLVLDMDRNQETATVKYSLMTAFVDTKLKTIRWRFRNFRTKARESFQVDYYSISLSVSIDTVASQKMFVIRMNKETGSLNSTESFRADWEMRLLDFETAIKTVFDEYNQQRSDKARAADVLRESHAEGEKRKARLRELDKNIERLEHERAELKRACDDDERKKVEYLDRWDDHSQGEETKHLELRKLLIEETLSRKDEHQFTSSDDLAFEPGQSAISWAAAYGRVNLFNLLLRNGPGDDVECQSNSRRTPLSYAARNGHQDIVRLLLQTEEVVPDSTDGFGRTPLMHAARNGHSEVVRLLLATKRIDIDRHDQMGWTALAHAAVSGEMLTFISIFEAGGSILSIDLGGKTVLSLAAARGHAGVVDFILNDDPTLRLIKDEKGWTPLAYAVLNGHTEVVRRFFREVKDIKVEIMGDDKVMSALFQATSSGHTAVVTSVVNRCGNLSGLRDDDGRSLLTRAAAGGHLGLTSFFMTEPGVDLNLIDSLQQTPLNWACLNGHHSVVICLLSDPWTDPNCVGTKTESALSWAARNGHSTIVQHLLIIGRIRKDVKDNQGKTALQWAIDNGYYNIAAMLRRNGVFGDLNE